jgi:predicted ArsR family transcriptional regulator
MSTDKDRIHYSLFNYIAQRADYLAKQQGIPAPSVRRILSELVTAGRAKWVAKDLFGAPGYLATNRRVRRA